MFWESVSKCIPGCFQGFCETVPETTAGCCKASVLGSVRGLFRDCIEGACWLGGLTDLTLEFSNDFCSFSRFDRFVGFEISFKVWDSLWAAVIGGVWGSHAVRSEIFLMYGLSHLKISCWWSNGSLAKHCTTKNQSKTLAQIFVRCFCHF